MVPLARRAQVIKKEGKYGLCSWSGKKITDCQYTDFNLSWILKDEELIPLAMNNKWGLVSTKDGKQQGIFKYDAIGDKHNDLISVTLNGKKGIIDTQGNQIADFNYSDLRFADNGYIEVVDGTFFGILDSLGNTVLDCKYNVIISLNGSRMYKENGKWGVFSEDYQILTDCIYDSFQMPSDGVLTLSIKNKTKYGAIDAKTGKEIIPFEYSSLSNYSEGLFAASKTVGGKEKYGYIDAHNKEVIPFIYEGADVFSEGLACVHKKVGNGYFFFTNEACGFINKQGEVVIPFKYKYQWSSIRFSEGLAAIREDGTSILSRSCYGYINREGEFVIQPQFDRAEEFENGLARVKNGDKYGYINTEGAYVIPCQYDDYSYSPDRIELKKDGTTYGFDYHGNRIF